MVGAIAPLRSLSAGDPHHRRYRRYVNDLRSGLLSTELPLDDGLVISTVRPATLPA